MISVSLPLISLDLLGTGKRRVLSKVLDEEEASEPLVVSLGAMKGNTS